MIELERHIEILLLENDCVIVPGLGGFVAHHVEACYDDRSQSFLPPMRTLGFNPKLQINDSLLAQSYIEAYDISYPDAIIRIEDEVNELRQRIENDGYYELNDIGTIQLNDDGNYEFLPCEAGILTPLLYGLNAVEIEPIKQQKPAVIEMPTVQKEDIDKQDSLQEGNTLKVMEVHHEEQEEEPAIRVKLSTIRNTLAIAACIIAVCLIVIPFGKGNNSFISMGRLDTSILKRMMPKDITKGEPVLKTDTITKQEPAIDISEEQNDLQEEGSKAYYSIVLASCLPEKNAKNFAAQLQEQGFTEVSIINRSNGAKVIYGSYASEGDAYNALRKMHTNEHFREAWVYLVKP